MQVTVPDIGDFRDVPVIEVLVKPGDRVEAEDALITLESDKATMDVPAPSGGTVKDVKVKVGDKVSEGMPILTLEAPAGAKPAPTAAPKTSVAAPPASAQSPAGVADVRVPDIGEFKDVPVIEVLVKPGDVVNAEDPLVTLESDKATMDVPAPLSGTVRELRVRLGDKVSEGSVILTLVTDAAAIGAPASPATPEAQRREGAPPPVLREPAQGEAPRGRDDTARGNGSAQHRAAASEGAQSKAIDETSFALAYAGPGARRIARELGVDLGRVHGSGDKGRILREDVEKFARGGQDVKARPAAGGAAGGTLDLIAWPSVDFAKYGPVEPKPLPRIRRISGANLHRNWVMIPHVTNHDDADITDLEAFRVELNRESEKSGVRVSMLAFLIKAVVATLMKFPDFNASLDGETLIVKKYWHIGFAADTPNGLVVPVIREADRKGILDIAREMGELAKLARDGKLKPDQMQGGTFTISSLGGIGGTYFTPIINAPEVAILGVCRSAWRQVSPDGKNASWRLLLPLSLSFDHRVIDGAGAARFNAHLAGLLADMRRILV
jgi:pyruvate dehydrogenase E2 component (dihydrolipoamide acetyltransferase)